MISSILILLLFALAAVCNAAMDVVTHHYEDSVFNSSEDSKYYYNPTYSWKNKYINGDVNQGRKKWFFNKFTIHPAFTDFWHLQKSSMIVLICIALAVALFGSPIIITWWYFIIVVVVLGTIWNSTFNLFYNKIFRK
jgi:hypothetical protein